MSPFKYSTALKKLLQPEECIACIFSFSSGRDGVLFFSLFSACMFLHIKISNKLQAWKCLKSSERKVTGLCSWVLDIISMLSHGNVTDGRGRHGRLYFWCLQCQEYEKEPDYLGALWVQHHEVSYFVGYKFLRLGAETSVLKHGIR